MLWRLQNGELDGIRARVIVIGGLFASDLASHRLSLPEVLAGNAAILAEIRKRQPQARIVLVAVPRGLPVVGEADAYARAVAAQFAAQANGKQIRFLDLSPALGASDARYRSGRGSALNAAGYAAWAEAMAPAIATR